MTNGIQKRLRAEYETAVILTTNSMKPRISISRNISLNGIYVESSADLPVGEACSLEIIISGKNPQNSIKLTLKGIIIRSDNDGAGITFTDMTDHTLSELKKLILYNSENASKFLKQCEENPGFQ